MGILGIGKIRLSNITNKLKNYSTTKHDTRGGTRITPDKGHSIINVKTFLENISVEDFHYGRELVPEALNFYQVISTLIYAMKYLMNLKLLKH